MIQHPCCRRVLLSASILLLWTAWLKGQLPPSIVTSVDATQARPQIDEFINTQLARLSSTDTSSLSTARSLIINETTVVGVTPGFLDQYADSLNAATLPLAANKDVRVRLNVAIIVARVASKAANARLEPVTLVLLKDNSDAVVLWAMQSAKYVLPILVTSDGKQATALSQQVLAATKAHLTTAISEEAYRTMTLDPGLPGGGQDLLKTESDKDLAQFLPQPIALFTFRVSLYADNIPPQPMADAWGASFFSKGRVWGLMTPAEQGQALATMIDLLRGAARQKPVAGPQAGEMLDIMKRTGQALHLIADRFPKDHALAAAAQSVAVISNETDDAEIDTRIKSVDDAVRGLGLPMPAAAPTTAESPGAGVAPSAVAP